MIEYKIKPWAHQLEGIKKARKVPCFALFFEPGTGKTLTVLNILREKMFFEKKCLKTLVFCPNIVCDNWKRETKDNTNIPQAYIKVVTDSLKKRAKIFKRDTTKFFITPYSTLQSEECVDSIYNAGFEALVFDESHYLKSPTTKRTKNSLIITKSPSVKYKYLLTGTPVLNSLLDLQPQFALLDGGILGENFYHFRANYFYKPAYDKHGFRNNYNWVVDPELKDKLMQKIKPFSLSALKKDVLDLPPLINERIEVELTPEMKKNYDEMKNHCITFFKDEACTAKTAMTKMLRLQQITSGFVKTEDEVEKIFKDCPKLKALDELLESLRGHKVIIWAVFRQNFKQIAKLLEKKKIGFSECHGHIKDKEASMRKFKEDKDCMVYLGHPGSGGIGVNLVEASYSIWFSRNFSLENTLQARARNHRGGSEIHKTITCYDLVAKKTIDLELQRALTKKEDLSNFTLSELKEMI